MPSFPRKRSSPFVPRQRVAPGIFDPCSIFDRLTRIVAINPNLSRRAHDSFRLIFPVSSRRFARIEIGHLSRRLSQFVVSLVYPPRAPFFFFTSSFDGEERRRRRGEEEKEKGRKKKKIRERDGKKEVLLMGEASGNEESGSFQGCSIECRWDLIITRIISNFKKPPLIARPRENSKSAH